MSVSSQDWNGRRYLYPGGQEVFVSGDPERGYCVVAKKPEWPGRIQVRDLPYKRTGKEAQDALDAWAAEQGLPEVGNATGKTARTIIGRVYAGADGREIFVDHGISYSDGSHEWGSFRRSKTGSLDRVRTKALPMRPTREEAQEDLDRWARASGGLGVKRLVYAGEGGPAESAGNGEGESEPMNAQPERQNSGPKDTILENVALAEIMVGENVRDETTVSDEFLASLDEMGINQTVLLTLSECGSLRPYLLVAGHRRLMAAERLGWTHIPALIKVMSPEEIDRARLEENLQREDLKPLEKARGIRKYLEVHQVGQVEAGKRLHYSQGWVSSMLRLNDLPERAQAFIRDRGLSDFVAVELARAKATPEVMGFVLDQLEEKLKGDEAPTVREVRSAFVDAAYRQGKHLGYAHFDYPKVCRGCDSKARVAGQDHCIYPACLDDKNAQYDAQALARVRAGETGVVLPNEELAPDALTTCPADCTHTALVRRVELGPVERVCLDPESPCREQHAAEAQAAADAEEQAESQTVAAGSGRVIPDEETRRRAQSQMEAEEKARADAEARRSGRVENFLARRVASNQKGFSSPEMRCMALYPMALYSDEAGDYLMRVLDVTELELEAVLVGLSTRNLTTVAIGFVQYMWAGSEPESLTGGLFLTALEALLGSGESWEPAGEQPKLDIGLLANPDKVCDKGCGPCKRRVCVNTGDLREEEDGDADDLADSEEDGGAEEGETPDPSDPDDPFPVGPHPTVTTCPINGQETTAAACAACCSEKPERCSCPHVKAWYVGDNPGPFHCPGGREKCPGDGDPVPVIECSGHCHGCGKTGCLDNPGYAGATQQTTCANDEEPYTPEECRACCMKAHRDEGSPCCDGVTQGVAPWKCPGKLDECPEMPGEAQAGAAAAEPKVCEDAGDCEHGEECGAVPPKEPAPEVAPTGGMPVATDTEETEGQVAGGIVKASGLVILGDDAPETVVPLEDLRPALEPEGKRIEISADPETPVETSGQEAGPASGEPAAAAEQPAATEAPAFDMAAHQNPNPTMCGGKAPAACHRCCVRAHRKDEQCCDAALNGSAPYKCLGPLADGSCPGASLVPAEDAGQ